MFHMYFKRHTPNIQLLLMLDCFPANDELMVSFKSIWIEQQVTKVKGTRKHEGKEEALP